VIRLLGRQTSGNVQKIIFCLEELRVPYGREDYGRQFGNTLTEAYRKLNPTAKVPTLIDGDLVIWESHTILRYLAAVHGPALKLRIGRPFDRKLQATLNDRAERNVGDAETIEREPMAPGDVAIEYFELGQEIGTLRCKIRRPLGRCLLGVFEHGDIWRVQCAEQPVHPTLDHGALGRRRAGQRRPMHGVV